MVSLSRTRIVMHSLLNRDRTEITPKDYFKRCVSNFILQFVLSSSLAALTLYGLGISVLSITLGAALILVPMIMCLRFRRNTRSVVVKGDSLILKNYRKRSLVTSLRSIHKIKTTRLPGIYITRLEYNLDGRNRSTLIVNRSWVMVATPEKLIRKAMKLSQKERNKKANHKPGSVH